MDGKALLLMAVAGYRTGKWFSYSNKVVDFCTEKGTCLFLGTEEQTGRVAVAGGAAEGTGPRGFLGPVQEQSDQRHGDLSFAEISTLGKK